MKTYKEKEKKNITLTVIYNPRISCEKESWVLKKLGKVTDLFFIFPKAERRTRNLRKFSNLYGATYYGVQEKETEEELIWTALEYGQVLGGGYLGYYVVEGTLERLGEEHIQVLNNLAAGFIETSVWTSFELCWEDLKEVYEYRGGSFLERIWRVLWEGVVKDIQGMYISHTSTDPIIFLRDLTLEKIGAYFKENPVYKESFKESSFYTMISSATERICPESKINIEVKDAKT